MSATGSTPADELRRRMLKPQRHRLLHGYPLAAAVPPADGVGPHHEVAFRGHAGRGLIVGVLPHPFCNPAVTGCGFCTFPHEPGNAAKAGAVARVVAAEINQTVDRQMIDLFQRKVTALYFGGGTANLVEPTPFRELCKALADAFDLADAEVTLEGVPAYFLRGDPRLSDVLRETLPARHFRLSMGIQTFDAARLKQMGRTAFGTPDTFREVVALGHRLGFTVSADLLFNLPGQTRDEMAADVRHAIDLGLDHLGLYHLVLFGGLGTAWSQDDDLLAGLPDNERAAANWVELRGQLLASGFVQTSLTNFERAAFVGRADRFVYEDCSFRPDQYEAIGFGPGAASYAASVDFQHAIKVINPATADAYTKAVKRKTRVWDRAFGYGPHDQRVFWLTRSLARLELGRDRYRELFGSEMTDDFPAEFAAFERADLVEIAADEIRPTPRGMFFADSLAAVLAGSVIRANRADRLAGDRPTLPPDVLHDVRATENSLGHM